MLSKCIISGIIGMVLLGIGLFCFFCYSIGVGIVATLGSAIFFYDVVDYIKFKQSRKDKH